MLEKNYTPQDIEDKHYKAWEKAGAFKAVAREGYEHKGAFTIMMPPPNVTGNLHMGHALNYTLQDVLVRYHRMRGFTTLWQPGTDHAGIATQMVVERQLADAGEPSRREMGREKFLKRVWQWKEESGGAIVKQQKRLGLTPDWDRQSFTMDDGLSAAVRKIFVHLYKDGLIYRNKRLVNWDPKLLTAVSDLEVDAVECQGNLWYIIYDIAGEPHRTITVATTRPETLFGDTGIAVHPDDERYKDLIGKKAIVPFVDREIPIVADEYSDPEKGTGAVKITPAHDFNDFEVGERHNLEKITILDEHGSLTADLPEPFAGIERFTARKLVVKELEALGKIEKIEQTTHSVPHGERSGVVLEPRLTDQWFVNAESLAKDTLAAAHDGRTTIHPESGLNTYDHWLKNIQPWCISRQLWWGHQIPAWFGPDRTIFVAETEEQAQAQAKAHYGKTVDIIQETDVLDTWFSSALWPFSTLGWPEKTKELEHFYTTSCLITGSDILFFWVARMMMMGLYTMKEVPFKDVFLHALVRDEHGQKMSKTKGNVIDPLLVMDKYGADALRFTMTAFAAPGRDIKYSDALVETYRNFATKLWNAARFLEGNEVSYTADLDPSHLKLDLNRWIVGEFVTCLEDVESALSRYRFDEMATALYRFVWGTFCDWYIEFSKPLLFDGTDAEKAETRKTLGWVLGQLLHTLHPIMPFITEEIWQNLTSGKAGLLITNPWPLENKGEVADHELYKNKNCQDQFNWIIELITMVRSVRNDVNVPAGAKVPLLLVLEDPQKKQAISNLAPLILRLARLETLEVIETAPQEKGFVQGVIKGGTLYLSIDNVIDIGAEKARLKKNLKKVDGEITSLERKLSNKKFVDKAPEEIIAKNKERLQEEKELKEKLNTALNRLA